MILYQWAVKHRIPLEALRDLERMYGAFGRELLPGVVESDGWQESAVQSRVRLDAANNGIINFRNNVGVLRDSTGRPVRFGLANDSSRTNELVKSGDLIGIKPVHITHSMVGAVIGQFWSRECKAQGWVYTGNKHEKAQKAWIDLVNGLGGDAAFTTGGL